MRLRSTHHPILYRRPHRGRVVLTAIGVVVVVAIVVVGLALGSSGDQALSSARRGDNATDATSDTQAAAPSTPRDGESAAGTNSDSTTSGRAQPVESDPAVAPLPGAASADFGCPPAVYEDYVEVDYGAWVEIDVLGEDRACGEIVSVEVLQDELPVAGARGEAVVVADGRVRYTATGYTESASGRDCLDRDWFTYFARDPSGVDVVSGIVSVETNMATCPAGTAG